jgi:hypothetical protein
MVREFNALQGDRRAIYDAWGSIQKGLAPQGKVVAGTLHPAFRLGGIQNLAL